MKDGFIFLYRRLLHWEWYHDTNMVRLFIHLLLKANYEDSNYKGYEIKRGALIFGRLQAAKDLGMSERAIRTCLKRLKATGEVTIRATSHFSIITLCHYDKYQSKKEKTAQPNDYQSAQQVTSERPASDQQATTYKEDNNIISKEEKETNTCAGEIFSFEIFWNMYDKKVYEGVCRQEWNATTVAERELIRQHLPAYMESTPDKKFRKDPASYLACKGWLNEVIKPGAQQKEKSAIDLYIESEK